MLRLLWKINLALLLAALILLAAAPNGKSQAPDAPDYFKNQVYVELWGSAVFSLNYARLFPTYNILLGAGAGVSPYARDFNLFKGDGGEIVNFHIQKQFPLTQKLFYGFGAGLTHDFEGGYDDFFDPFYIKLVLNRQSVSRANDRLYYGFSLHYVKWDYGESGKWRLRPSVKLGVSF
jgi:hypothetical protein